MSNSIANADDLIQEGKADLAVDVLRNAAKNGETEAKFRLGLLYYRGKDVPFDVELAWHWLEKADLEGHKKAPYYLGRLCTHDGRHEVAMEWYQRSAERGFHGAIARIGYCYLIGQGTEQSRDKAFEYYMKAKIAGNFQAHAKVCRMLLFGHKGVKGFFRGFCELFNGLFSVIKFAFSEAYKSEQDMTDKFVG